MYKQIINTSFYLILQNAFKNQSSRASVYFSKDTDVLIKKIKKYI